MRFFIFLLALPLFLTSCGDSNNSNPKDSVTTVDQFREDVLSMQRAGLLKNIADKKLDSLIRIYRNDSLNGLKEILVASGDMLHMRVGLNGRPLGTVLQQICDTIGMRFPDLKCDEVQTKVIPKKPGANDTDWVVLRVRFGQTWYERKLYYFTEWPVDELLYKVYNVMMADSGISERLHMVEFTCTNCPKRDSDFLGTDDVNRIGFLRLTKAQEDALLAIPALKMERDEEFSIFTTAQMQSALEKFEKTGLTGPADQKWYSEVKQDIQQNSVHGMEDFYDFLDTLFCTVNFNEENDYNPYYEAIDRMREISRGKFNPGEIYDSEANPVVRTVRYTLNGKVYEKEYEQRTGIFDPNIIDDVNKALEEQKIPGAFYTVLTRKQVVMLVFIENNKIDQAIKSGFFTEITKGASESIKLGYSQAPIL